MPEAASAVATEAQPTAACKHHPDLQMVKPVCKCQKLLWPRRIHALTGLIFTAFLAVHLGICATAMRPALYQQSVNWVEATLASMPGLVLLGVFLPFAVQVGFGVLLLQHHGLNYNVNKCNRGGKLRFYLQRTSGLVILAFFLLHVGTLHKWGLHLLSRVSHAGVLARYASGGLFAPQAAYASTVLGLSHVTSSGVLNLALLAFTVVGFAASAFHAANGAWTGGIVWKIAGTRVSRPVWGAVSYALGIALAALGVIALLALVASGSAQAVLSHP